MAPKSSPRNCPQCGASTRTARALEGRLLCGGCGQELISCGSCGAVNLTWSNFCHNCGAQLTSVQMGKSKTTPTGRGSITDGHTPLPSETEDMPIVERMRLCASCNKAIGDSERFCSYCGSKQVILHPEPHTSLDPYTMKTAVAVLARITEARDHSEYSTIDQLTTTIGRSCPRKGKAS